MKFHGASKLLTERTHLSHNCTITSDKIPQSNNTPPSERRGGKKQRGGKAARDEKSIILKKQKVKARKGNII